MRMNITDMDRINTCGYLKKNNWDYETDQSSNPSYFTGMKEVLRWHYNRGKPIDQESFMAFISNLHYRLGIKIQDRFPMENAFRSFINTEFYKNLTEVFCNYETDIKFNKTDYLEHVIPFVMNPNKPTFIYIEDKLDPQSIFLERFDVMHNAVWSFYYLGKYATYLRFWFDGKEIKRETIKTDEKHFNFSKERLVLLGKTVNNFTVPPVQTCLKCSKLSICERYVRSKKRGRKNGTTTKAN